MKKLVFILFLFSSCSKLTVEAQILAFASTTSTSSVQYAAWQSGIQVYGDSYTAGYLLSSPSTQNWFAQVCSAKSITGNNLAVSGAASRLATTLFMKNAPLTTLQGVVTFYGFNGTRVTDSLRADTAYKTMAASHRALCAVQWAKSYVFPYSNSSAVMTFSNTTSGAASSETPLQDWGSRDYYIRHNDASNGGANWFNRTVTTNETASFSITGSVLAIGTWGCDNRNTQLSRIKVTVDGVDKVTYNPAGVAWTGNKNEANITYTQDGIIQDAIIVSGLSNTSHSVVLTFLDGGKTGVIDYAASLMTAAEATNYPVWVLNLPHMNSTGYNAVPGTTTEAIIDAGTAYRKSALTTAFPSYPIPFVDINDPVYFDVGNDMDADGIHRNYGGHTHISNKVLTNIK